LQLSISYRYRLTFLRQLSSSVAAASRSEGGGDDHAGSGPRAETVRVLYGGDDDAADDDAVNADVSVTAELGRLLRLTTIMQPMATLVRERELLLLALTDASSSSPSLSLSSPPQARPLSVARRNDERRRRDGASSTRTRERLGTSRGSDGVRSGGRTASARVRTRAGGRSAVVDKGHGARTSPSTTQSPGRGVTVSAACDNDDCNRCGTSALRRDRIRRLCRLTVHLRGAVQRWQQQHGVPFMYHGVPYGDVLALEAVVQRAQQDAAAIRRAKRVMGS
jgi:hypothetical protein